MTKQEFIQRFVIQNWAVAGSVFTAAEEAWTAIEGRLRPEGPSFDVTKVEKAEWERDDFGDSEEAVKLVLGPVEISIDRSERNQWRAGLYTSADTDHICDVPLPMAKTQDQAKVAALAWFTTLLAEWDAKLP